MRPPLTLYNNVYLDGSLYAVLTTAHIQNVWRSVERNDLHQLGRA